MVARAELRHRLAGVVALAVCVALGLGAALGAFIAADRTEHAYGEYVDRARVTDVVFNPSLDTKPMADAVRRLPHVRHVATDVLLYAGIDDGKERTIGELARDQQAGEVRGSPDSRFRAVDRPIIDEGRAPTGRDEVFVTTEARRALEARVGHPVHVGDRIPLAVYWAGADPGINASVVDEPASRYRLGVDQLRVSGFGRLADEVLDDGLYERERFILSPDVVRRYDCLVDLPAKSELAGLPDDEALQRLIEAFVPRTCARNYRYFAITVDDPANVPQVKLALDRLANRLNATLPGVLLANGVSYYPITTTRRSADRQVQHAVRPLVVTLRLFGVVALLATAVVGGIAAGRRQRRAAPTDRTLRALGMRPIPRIAALVAPSLLALGIGTALALLLGWLASPIGPVGEVARTDPGGGFSAPARVTALVVPIFVVVLVAVVLALAALAIRRDAEAPARERSSLGALRRVVPPPVADGVGVALGRHRIALPVAATVAVAAMVAAATFGASLGGVVDHAPRYGWPWQAGALTNVGYGNLKVKTVAADLRRDPDVRSWDVLAFTGAAVAGHPTPLLYGNGPVDLPVVRGRAPARPGEIALGTDTARRAGVKLGERVRVVVSGGHQSLRYVGAVALPALGPLLSDRTGLGLGAFAIVRAPLGSDTATFVGLHLRHGADPTKVLAVLRPRTEHWDVEGDMPLTYTAPIRPPEIVNVDAMRGGPMLLAGALAVALFAALALSIGATVAARRREYAIQRSLGYTAGQVGQSVRWQAVTTVVVGLVLGVPLGIVAGRWAWTRFADELGVAQAASIPALVILAIAAVAVVGALLVSLLPARRAGRYPPAAALGTA
jgi:hypothetical protein